MQTAEVFKAVSDPTRRTVLELLRDGDRTANDLAEPFSMSQPAISRHLRVLREAGLVHARKEGRNRVYHLDPAALKSVFDWAQYFEGFWRSGLARLGDELDRVP